MNKLFLGISNHVVCLSKKTGEQLWKTKLKSSTITNDIPAPPEDADFSKSRKGQVQGINFVPRLDLIS